MKGRRYRGIRVASQENGNNVKLALTHSQVLANELHRRMRLHISLVYSLLWGLIHNLQTNQWFVGLHELIMLLSIEGSVERRGSEGLGLKFEWGAVYKSEGCTQIEHLSRM